MTQLGNTSSTRIIWSGVYLTNGSVALLVVTACQAMPRYVTCDMVSRV